MIQCQLKLRMCKRQERTCEQWLYHLTSVWNFAIRKIELNANNKIYFSQAEFNNVLAGHSVKLGIPSRALQGTLFTAFQAWSRCFKGISGKPRLKGRRNKLTSILFRYPIKSPKGNRISIHGLGPVRFHKMALPDGSIKCGRIVRKASGWYLSLSIDADPKLIERTASGRIGIDPGFHRLLTTSTGEIISHPRELEAHSARLAQSQRGYNRVLSSRIQERIANRRRDRNHKLSHRLIAENTFIAFSKDNTSAISKRFGKSVASSSHYQLRQMLTYKSPISGTQFVEVDSRLSTKTCNECGSQSGPSGISGLSVRLWVCNACGAQHDRDVNAAINTLNAGAGCALEMAAIAVSPKSHKWNGSAIDAKP